jgi:Rieske Fe-S protein
MLAGMKMNAQPNAVGRRSVLAAGAAGVGAAGLLAACGDDSESPASSSSSSSEAAGASPSAPGASAGALASTGDIPVGSGKIFADQKVVVTQPAEGDFKAFSALCTHQGCLVTKVDSSAITCSCHMSRFSLTDGSVLGGPATSPLPSEQITVTGPSITLS